MVQEYPLFQRVGRLVITTPLNTSEFLILKKKRSGFRRLFLRKESSYWKI